MVFQKDTSLKLTWMSLFAIAFGWIEASVVVYLRLVYYPNGFQFPVQVIPWNVGWIELVREAATLLLLLSIAMIASKKPLIRFAWFMFVFGIWDIIYYAALKVTIDWPESLLTWDLLFLLPLPWIGPVIAPVLVSIAMIIACLLLLWIEDHNYCFVPGKFEWLAIITGGIIIIVSFIWDYRIAFTTGDPVRFRWEVFTVGMLLGLVVFSRRLLITLREGKKDMSTNA